MRGRDQASESQIKALVRLALGKDERVVLWNNPVGQSILFVRCPNPLCGTTFPTHPNATGPQVKYGLREGASDLVGMLHTGRFFCLETKDARGKQREMQRLFEASVQRHHGFYSVVRSPEESLAALERALRGELG